MKRSLTVFLFSSLLAVSLYAAKAPDWVSGKSSKHSEAQYLLGVGIADNLDAARSNARAEIAKIFKARVVQEAMDLTSESTSLKKNKAESSAHSESNMKTEVFTDQILEGVQISDTFFDKKKKKYFALALLDKGKVNNSLSQKLLDQEEIIRANLAQFKQSSNRFDRLRNLNLALEAIDVKKEILARKRVVEPVSMGDPDLSISYSETLKNKNDILDKMLFVVYPDKVFPESGAVLMAKLTQMGFKVKPADTADKDLSGYSVIDVKYGISINSVDRNNPQWKFYGWQINLEIIDRTDKGKILAAGSDKGEISHLTAETAKSKAVTAAAEAAARDLEKQLSRYFYEKPEVK